MMKCPPFYLQIYDPHQSFALTDDLTHAVDVTSLFATTNDEMVDGNHQHNRKGGEDQKSDEGGDGGRRTFQVEIPPSFIKNNVDVIKYEIGSASNRCVSPLVSKVTHEYIASSSV